jgi:hypothetical protein
MAHANLLDRNDHEYGAFILAEFLEELYGPGFILDTWELIGEGSGIGGLQAVQDVLVQDEGLPGGVADVLPTFWAEAYRLEDDSPFDAADVAVWRDVLSRDWRTDADYADDRPNHLVIPMNQGRTVSGSTFVEHGGAAFVDFVHRLQQPGEVTIEVKNLAPRELWFEDSPTSDDIRLTLYSFDSYPHLCDEPTMLPLSADGIASATLQLSSECTFSTLVVSHYDMWGDQKSQEFTATCDGCIRVRNNAEGGTDGTAVTVENSGGASGDAFDFVTPYNTILEFDDDGYTSDGSLGYKISQTVLDMAGGFGWEFDPSGNDGGLMEALVRVSAAVDQYPSDPLVILGADQMTVAMLPTGQLSLFGEPGASTDISAPIGQMFRVELRFRVGTPGVSELELRLFSDPHAAIPDDTVVLTDRFVWPIDGVYVGAACVGGAACFTTHWIDQWEVLVGDA